MFGYPSTTVFVKVIFIIVGATMMAILGGTTNAFNNMSLKLQADLQLSPQELQLFAGMGLVGVYFVLPAGYLLDRFGPVLVGIIGSAMVALAYTAMSFCTIQLWPVALLCIIAVGFGSGAIFLAALGTSITVSPTGGGWGVAIVSAGMSFSVATTIFAQNTYSSQTGCNANHCWREYAQLMAWGCLILPFPGSLLLILFKRSDYPHLQPEVTETENEEQTPLLQPKERMSLLQSLVVFKEPYFWALFWSFFVGVSAALIVLTHAFQIWDWYNKDPALSDFGGKILLIFSCSNAASNVFCGVVSDSLNKRNIMKHSSFLAVVQIFFALVYVAVGVLFYIRVESHTSTIAAGILLASIGLQFGCVLVLLPIIIGETYGPSNFGKMFAYLEISSSLASVCFPLIITAVSQATGNFVYVMFGSAVLLVTSGVALLLRPRRPRKAIN